MMRTWFDSRGRILKAYEFKAKAQSLTLKFKCFPFRGAALKTKDKDQRSYKSWVKVIPASQPKADGKPPSCAAHTHTYLYRRPP